MAHNHLPDAELARYATDPESLPFQRRQAIERATAACAICRTTLDFYSVVTPGDLADPELWEPRRSGGDERMRAYIERIEAEDRNADEVLAERKLLESPIRTAWADLERDRRLLTGGVARRLTAHAHDIHENEPLAAVTFADAAIAIAEALPDHAYPWNAVYELRGTAWKERANALLRLGNFPAALESLVQAECAYLRLESAGCVWTSPMRCSLPARRSRSPASLRACFACSGARE